MSISQDIIPELLNTEMSDAAANGNELAWAVLIPSLRHIQLWLAKLSIPAIGRHGLHARHLDSESFIDVRLRGQSSRKLFPVIEEDETLDWRKE